MDKAEAKHLLEACRPNGRDLSDPAFAEALALAGSDPELKAWWQARQNFDRKVSAKLEEVPMPAHLRATILAGGKIVPMRPRYLLPYWLAAAALFAVLAVLGSNVLFSPKPTGLMASDEYTAAILPYLGHDNPALAMTSPDQQKVLEWLKDHHTPTGSVPANMAALPTVGCQTLAVHGHSVSLICFAAGGNGIVHLFIVERQALSDPPGPSPEFKRSGDWSTASWSDGDRSYVLASRAGPDTLKRLL
jgi:hypothetical protein